jgi:hypothetical protein
MFLSGHKRLYPRNSERKGICVDPEDRWQKEQLNRVDPDARTHFKAGIDESLAKKLKILLANRKDLIHKNLEGQILFVNNDGNRYEVNPKTNKLTCEKKNKFKTYEISLFSHDYDLRIACATENKVELLQTYESMKSTFTMERHKSRTSYEKSSNAFWKIDFTEVISKSSSSSSTTSTTKKNGSSSTTSTYSFADAQEKGKKEEQEQAREYELEFELKPNALTSWLKCSEKEIQKVTGEICKELLEFLNYCIPSWMDTKEEIVLSPVEKASVENEVRELNSRLRGGGGESKTEFLGSMPINLFRSSLDVVLKSDYYLTEKTDGVRYLFYIVGGGGAGGSGNRCFFMNRSIKYFDFPPFSNIIANCFPASTILDGEIVFNFKLKKSIFLIFFILCYNCDSFINNSFEKRYEFLKTTVIPSYEHNYQRQCNALKTANPNLPIHSLFTCYYKRFLKKEKLSTLLKCFHEESCERMYREDKNVNESDNETDVNGLRSDHKTDGIIFQPDSPYKIGKCYDLLKWKWSDLRSVDLKVVSRSSFYNIHQLHMISASDLFLTCTGPDNSSINISKRGDYNVGLSEFDTARLLSEIEELGASKLHSLIIEVIYDTTIGKWIYSKIRSDKKDPNYIDSVLGVFIEQAEAITIEELEYSIISSVKNFPQDYSIRLVKPKAQLLDWQRNLRK